jgi:hypothetical protein
VIPAIIYAAKSTNDERGSIPTQLSEGTAAAIAEGQQVCGTYHDEAASAYKGNRGDGLARAKTHALALAAEHGACHFWIQHSDRVARGDGIDADHLAEVWYALRRGRVRMRSVDDDHNLEDAIRVVLIGERNHEDSARKATNVSRGMRRRKVERGLHNGCPHEKLGYRNVRYDDGRVKPDTPRVIDPAGARLVRRIFDDALAGISQKQIARDIAAEGIPTPRGGVWSQATIRGILYDPYYAGYFRDTPRNHTPTLDEPLVKGQHEAIVTLDEWRRVLEISQQRRRSGDGQRGRTSARPALFTHGHLRCGYCGSSMGVRFAPGRKTDWHRYVCRGHERDKHSCPMTPVDAAAVEAMMFDVVQTQPGILVGRVREAVESLLATRDVTADRLAEAERDLATLVARRDKIESDYLAGELPARLYGELRDKLDTETVAAQAQVDQLRSRAAELTTALTGDEVEQAVATVIERISEVVADSGRVETARNVIRQAWPTIILRRNGDDVELELGDVSPGFAQALSSTMDYNGFVR